MTFSKKGTAMVEAALVWPVVILSLVSVIYILINIYSYAEKPARFHMQLNEAAGEYSETYTISPTSKGDFDISRGIARVNGECEIEYVNGALINKDKDGRLIEDASYILREKRHMRMADNVRE